MPVDAIIRDPAFAKRLAQACDASPHCPDKHRGRLTWIMDQFKLHGGGKISAETVRRWSEGESKPREAKNVILAKILGVDPSWLYLGVEGAASSKRRTVPAHVKALADAAAHLLEVHEAMGNGQSHAAVKVREALEEYRKSA
ncbi:hypothetical protein [Sphingomonas hankookensis]|uniref:hypothetical protein n=1 Tax=Sphingomonas hankookensis TaxID=563996 RepID=UPI003D302655